MKVVDVIRETNRPEKTVYSITDAGREEFERLYFEQLLKKSICIDQFMLRFHLLLTWIKKKWLLL
ncbi:hypothetical protein MUB16_20195 [Priestia sp. OVL9]|nr:hypothetical protein [Priestia sp. OVL9]